MTDTQLVTLMIGLPPVLIVTGLVGAGVADTDLLVQTACTYVVLALGYDLAE